MRRDRKPERFALGEVHFMGILCKLRLIKILHSDGILNLRVNTSQSFIISGGAERTLRHNQKAGERNICLLFLIGLQYREVLVNEAEKGELK